jgi:hypothetical protein
MSSIQALAHLVSPLDFQRWHGDNCSLHALMVTSPRSQYLWWYRVREIWGAAARTGHSTGRGYSRLTGYIDGWLHEIRFPG